MKSLVAAIVMLLLAPVVLAGTGPEVRLVCPGPASLPPGPDDLPPATPATTMLRDDPDGLQTLVLAIDDPFVPPYAYTTTELTREVAYTHRWGADLVTVGIVVDGVRIPLVILEGRGLPQALLLDALDVASIALDGASIFLREAGVDPGSSDALQSAPPEFVWTTFRRIEGQEAWAGFARTRQATATTGDNGRATCLRLEIVAVGRTADETRSLGGAYVQASKIHREELGVVSESFGILAGATVAGIDTPMAGTRMDQALTSYSATNEISLGATDERGRYHPLVGLRQESVYGLAPEGYNSMLAVGTYAIDGGFVPVAGLRSHFERDVPLGWANTFLASGGPGTTLAGDWEQDLGVFDPFARFVPLLGTTYDDALDVAGRASMTGIRARHAHQAMLTVGAWAQETYLPLAGATYDGEETVLGWTQMEPGEVPGDWLASVGAFSPVVGYVPALGVEYVAHPGIEETFLVGTFAASYDSFVPLAGARWRSDRPSAPWLMSFEGRAPSAATLEVGPVVSGELTPVARVEIEAGEVDRYHVHLVAGDASPRVASACLATGEAGVAAGGMPLVVVRLGPTQPLTPPEAVPQADCGA